MNEYNAWSLLLEFKHAVELVATEHKDASTLTVDRLADQIVEAMTKADD